MIIVISTRRNANITIQSLRQCWSEASFSSVVSQTVSALDLKVDKRLTHSQFKLREARAPRHGTLRRIHALLGEHTQMELTILLILREKLYISKYT